MSERACPGWRTSITEHLAGSGTIKPLDHLELGLHESGY